MLRKGNEMLNPTKPYHAKNLIFNKSAKYNQKENQAQTGYIDVSVYQDIVNTPIKDATVRISSILYSGQFNELAEGKLIAVYKTDDNGKVPVTELPVLNELMPGNKGFYIVAVHAEEFYSAYVFNIQIYPDITSSFNVYLSNTTSETEKFNFFIRPTTEQIHRQ